MKRNATRHHRTTRQSVLHLRVVSPRIVWFGFLRYTGGLFKLATLLVVLGGLGWAGWRGLEHVFYQNPDFQLKVIDLNPNPVLDEIGVAELAGIDLTKSPSLFTIDVPRTLEKLQALPSITEAKVERHLPDTLVVRIIPRTPRAWIATGESIDDSRRANTLLVDTLGIAYPCPANQLQSAATLPVIQLDADPAHELVPGKPVTHPYFRHCLSLLDAARDAVPESTEWIDSIRRVNQWSLLLTTRHETQATFSLGDHASQMKRLCASLDHAAENGQLIHSINLIPKHNVPVTLRSDMPHDSPRAIPVMVDEEVAEEELHSTPPATTRRARDLNTILNRH